MRQVIYVMWTRQLKRYFRAKSRMIGLAFQSFLILVALGFGLGPVFEKAGEGDYLNFIAPGMITMGVLMTALMSGMEIVWDKQFGFLKETLVAPVSRLEIVVGKAIGGATISMLQGLLMLVLAMLIGFDIKNYLLIPVAVLFMFLIGLLFASLGVAIASKIEDMQGFGIIMNFLVMPFFFLSGALFPVADLPKALQLVTTIDPLAYGVDAMRFILVGGSFFGIYTDIAVILGLLVIVFYVGSLMFRRVRV